MTTMSRFEKLITTVGVIAGCGLATYGIARLQILYTATRGEGIVSHFIGLLGVILVLVTVYILIRIWDRWER